MTSKKGPCLFFSMILVLLIWLLGLGVSHAEAPQKLIILGQKTKQEFQKRFDQNVLPLLEAQPSPEAFYRTTKFFMNLPRELTYWLQDKVGDYRVRVQLVALRYRDIGHMASGPVERGLIKILHQRRMRPLLLQERRRGQIWLVYLIPLKVTRHCLPCHGAHARYAREIKKHFPEDKASGLRVGNLRGAIVIEMARATFRRFVSKASKSP